MKNHTSVNYSDNEYFSRYSISRASLKTDDDQNLFERFISSLEIQRPEHKTHAAQSYIDSLNASHNENTRISYASDIYRGIRFFFYNSCTLPTTEFSDVLSILLATEIIRTIDSKYRANEISWNDALENLRTMQRNTLLLADENSNTKKVIDAEKLSAIQKIIPSFQISYNDGLCSMQLRSANNARKVRPEIRREDERVINLVLSTLESGTKPRYVYPYFFDESVISSFFQDMRSKGNAEQTINRHNVSLTSFERYLITKRILTSRSPVMQLYHSARVPAQQVPVFSTADMKIMFNYLNREAKFKSKESAYWIALRNTAIYRVLDATAIRSGELCSISLDHINLKKKIIFIPRAKGGKSRVLPLTLAAIEALELYLPERAKFIKVSGINQSDCPWLFLSKSCRRLGERDLVRLVKDTASNAGVAEPLGKQGWSPHAIRHRVAADIYSASQDIFTVSNLLGHKNINTTVKYLRSIDDSELLSIIPDIHPRN